MHQEITSTIFQEFLESAAKNPGKAAIYYKKDSSYISLSYHDLLLQSQYLSLLLGSHAINKGDHVAIILENDPWWPISYFALMQRGAVAVPLYTQAEPPELEYLLRHSDTKLIIASLITKPRVDGAAGAAGIPLLILEAPYRKTARPDNFHEATQVPIAPEDTAMIVYTSGTSGTPKGVILSHKNLLANARALIQLNLMHPEDCFPSMLPLHHTYPFMVNLLLPLLGGASISFVDALEAEEFFTCIAQTPTNGIAAVPRLLSLLHEKISAGIAQKAALQRILLTAILACARLLPCAARISLTKLCMRDLHKKFGPSFRLMICGGAKLDITIAKAFDTWGFLVLEGYGLTEASPVVCFNTPGHARLGSVGRPLEGVTVTIDSADARGIGEICISGENLTSGYYKDPRYTAEVIRNGTFFTQDLGWIDKDGYVFITGRKNETIVLSSGKKINPEELEAHYRQSPYIREICVSTCAQAAQKDVLIALVVPNLTTKNRIRQELEAYSKTLPAYKRVTQCIISNEPLPKTLLGKIKRFEVAKKLGSSSSCMGAQGQAKKLSAEDQALINFPLCQKALEHLAQKAKKKVYPENHLELDLGLDSLDRISLFLEFQRLSGKTLDENLFFHMTTVRDALNALLIATGQKPPQA